MKTKIKLLIFFAVTIIALISCICAFVDNNNKWKALTSVESTIKADSLNYAAQISNIKFLDSLNNK